MLSDSDNDSFHSALDLDSSSDSVSTSFSLSERLNQHFSDFKKHFNICHINAQSIPQHFHELYDTFHSTPINAILISESWLNPSYSSTLCSLPGYVLLRNDRVNKRGGGVALYLQSNIPHKVLAASPSPYTGSIEFIMLEVVVNGTKIFLGVVYCPPSINYFSDFESLVSLYCAEYSHHIIMGDFNTDVLKDTNRTRDLQAILRSNCLHLLPLNPTHHNDSTEDTLLDLMLVSSLAHVVDHGQFLAPGFSRHDLIYLSYNVKPPKLRPKTLRMRNFVRINQDQLEHDASLTDWSAVLDGSTLDAMVDSLNKNILALFDKHAPVHTVVIKRPPAPWITPDIRKAMNCRDRAFARYKRNRCDDNWCYFKKVRNRCNQMVRAAKRRYVHNNIINCSQSNIWKFLKSLHISKPSQECSNIFSPSELNRHFSWTPVMDTVIKSSTVSLLRSQTESLIPSFNFSPITDVETLKLIQSLKSKAVGCDQISRDMILRIKDSVIHPITHIINCSLSSGVFPSLWRKAYVLPLPKISNPSTLNHFRPISILPYLSKILEATVHKQITNLMTSSNYLSPYQSGFRAGHSTATALLKVTEDVRRAMDASELTVLVLIDFSNAFNAVNHDILLAVLTNLGLSSSVIEWFSSYISGRQQAVYCNDSYSDWCDLSAGVPQGGILSPLLFSAFVNVITRYLSCSHHLYADDLQIYTHTDLSNINEAVLKINNDLNNVLEWSKKFGISVNPDKCQAIIIGSSRRIASLNCIPITPITFNDVIIPFYPHVKDLGLMIDSTLSWSPHITEVCRKVNMALRALYRHKNFLPNETKLLLVQSLVLPIIDYADVCYSDLSQALLGRLERLHNNCIRFVYGLRKYDHVSLYRSKLKWLPIHRRRQLRMLCTLFSILYNPAAPLYLKSNFKFQNTTHPRNLRSNNIPTLQVPFCRTDFVSRSFLCQSVRFWNALPIDIRNSPSKFSFKRAVKKYLLE